MSDERMRRGRVLAVLLGGGGVAVLLVPLALTWLRDRVRWSCGLAGDVDLPPSWVCADGIGYALPLVVLGVAVALTVVLALVALAAVGADAHARRAAATGLLALAAVPLLVQLWWVRPQSTDHEGPWLAWALPGALLLVAALACAALAIWRGPSRAATLAATACTVLAAIASLGGLAASAAVVLACALAAVALADAQARHPAPLAR